MTQTVAGSARATTHTFGTRGARRAFGAVVLLFSAAMSASLAGCAVREDRLLLALHRGDRAMHDERYADAAAWYEDYLDERPSKPRVLYDLARAYSAMGEPAAAREALTVAHELKPDNEKYIEALARAMAENGETGAAFEMLERIAAESMRADAYDRLGHFLLERGYADEGVRALRIAAEIVPEADGWVDLADAYASFGDEERALGALRHALWFDRDNDVLKARVRRLGGVPGPTFAVPPTP